MHSRELIQVAGLVCLRSKSLVEQGPTLDADALCEYWIATRCRFDHWGRLLKSLGNSRTPPEASDQKDLLERLSDEVILSEMLVRAVAAVCLAHDRTHTHEEAGPVARNALDGYRDSCRRLRTLRKAWWPSDGPKARLARSLEKQTARWTDALLSMIGCAEVVEPLAFDPSRVREFAYDQQTHGADSTIASEQLLLFSLRTSFTAAARPPVCDELNRRIAGAALGLLGAEVFDGHGLLRPVWMLRAERTTDDTMVLMDRLFDDDPAGEGFRLPQRWRI